MNTLADLISEAAAPLEGYSYDYDDLLEAVGDVRFVLLGEASHGTHEFYRERAQITRRLIEAKGFCAVAAEADWPDAYRVNRFVRGESDDPDAEASLQGFKRFPQWMWRNADVLDFVGWLRAHNDAQKSAPGKAGFYGLDLYSLHASIEAVLSYLDSRDASLAGQARQRYSCFDQFAGDAQAYGFLASEQDASSCENDVVKALTDLRLRESEYLRRDGRVAADEYFCAEQNAFAIKNAEQYYRTMYRGDALSWNLRDQHMMDTLASLAEHLEKFTSPAKIVVWAHNSHLGNARATQMSERGEFNLGQLVRERFGHQAMLIGLTTHRGTVTAASEWDAPAERKNVQPALRESYEALFHHARHARFWLDFGKHPQVATNLRGARLERAIGVIYRPETERHSHYFTAHLPDQFDGILHFDETRAVEPLEQTPAWVSGEVEEAFPTGF